MSKRLEELARRKALLISRCSHEREDIANLCHQVRLAFNLKGIGRSLSRTISAHPMFAAGISGLLVSGYAGKMTKGLGTLFQLRRLASPLWYWWSKRRSRS